MAAGSGRSAPEIAFFTWLKKLSLGINIKHNNNNTMPPLDFNALRKAYLANVKTNRKDYDKYVAGGNTGKLDKLKTKCCDGLWDQVLAKITEVSGAPTEGCFAAKGQYVKSFRKMLYDFEGDWYDIDAVRDYWLGRTTVKPKGRAVAFCSVCSVLERLHGDQNDIQRIKACHAPEKLKVFDCCKPSVQAARPTPTVAEAAVAQDCDLSGQDMVMLGMNTLEWKTEVYGKVLSTPAPFRGPDHILAIGLEGDFPNRIYIDGDDVKVIVKKHKNSNRKCFYVTEMTASDELARLLRPLVQQRTTEGKAFLFHHENKKEEPPHTELSLGRRMRRIVQAIEPDTDTALSNKGFPAFRHSFATYASDNHTGRECNHIALAMRHSVGTANSIYAQPNGAVYPKWENIRQYFERECN